MFLWKSSGFPETFNRHFMMKSTQLLVCGGMALLSLSAATAWSDDAVPPPPMPHTRNPNHPNPFGNMPSMEVMGKQWAEPSHRVPTGMEYVQFPASAAGAGVTGSVLVYKPESYDSGNKRYPVLYFLHGGMGNQADVDKLLPSYIAAMKSGALPEMIVVSVQGLPIGWYVNANADAPGVTSGPVEDVIIKNLVPFIDQQYRTIASRDARGLEGWSMGGFGALRLAFKFNDTFAHASSLSGAVIDFKDEPMKQFVTNTFGPADAANFAQSEANFDAVKPLTEAKRQLQTIVGRTQIRLIVGDQDWLYNKDGKKITQNFSEALTKLGIVNSYSIVAGVGHDLPEAIQAGSVPYPAGFWQTAFAAFR